LFKNIVFEFLLRIIKMCDDADRQPPGQGVEPGPAPCRPRPDFVPPLWKGDGHGLIAAGVGHIVVLDICNNVAYGFGTNNYGQLGDPDERGRIIRRPVVIRRDVRQVTANMCSTSLVENEGRVVEFGRVTPPAWARENNIKNLEPFSSGGFAILLTGESQAFGGDAGCISVGDGIAWTQVPAPVVSPLPIAAVASNGFHSLFLLADGSVATAGRNDVLQLGYPTPGGDIVSVMRIVPGLENVISIGVGGSFCAVVTLDGRVYTWGNIRNRLFHDSTLPTPMVHVTDAVSLSCGPQYIAVVHHDGNVSLFGKTGWINHFMPFPRRVEGLIDSPVIAVSCAGLYMAMLHDNNRVSLLGEVGARTLRMDLPVAVIRETMNTPYALPAFF
jgi:alpha-tubulin suppressor-like RCC1 family protein